MLKKFKFKLSLLLIRLDMLLQCCKCDGHANKAISTTLGTQRMVTQEFLTQELTELTLYSPVSPCKQTQEDTK